MESIPEMDGSHFVSLLQLKQVVLILCTGFMIARKHLKKFAIPI